MGAVGGITVAGTVADGYTWEFKPALTAADYPDTATIIYGDNAAQWRGVCCFGRQIVISSAFQGIWQVEMDTVCQDWDNTGVSFETIAYPSPLDTILGQMTSFYVDTTCEFAATPTARVESMIDWRLTIPGFHPKFFQDGRLDYSEIGQASRALTLEFTTEFDDTLAKAIIWEAWATGTPLYVRLESIGGVIPGTAPDANYTATIDLVLQPTDSETLDERDGNDIIKFTAETVYDSACAATPEWEITILNGDSGLPYCVT